MAISFSVGFVAVLLILWDAANHHKLKSGAVFFLAICFLLYLTIHLQLELFAYLFAGGATGLVVYFIGWLIHQSIHSSAQK